jgi:hypothetical protein
MITVGSVSRQAASSRFPFLAPRFPGRRRAIRELTHRQPDFVFWIFPNGELHDAKDSHAQHVPRGYEHILDDEPDYGGFLRGRVVSLGEDQLVVVYCRSDDLAEPGEKLSQLMSGMSRLPVPLRDHALVISDNADVYGTVADLIARSAADPCASTASTPP